SLGAWARFSGLRDEPVAAAQCVGVEAADAVERRGGELPAQLGGDGVGGDAGLHAQQGVDGDHLRDVGRHGLLVGEVGGVGGGGDAGQPVAEGGVEPLAVAGAHLVGDDPVDGG